MSSQKFASILTCLLLTHTLGTMPTSSTQKGRADAVKARQKQITKTLESQKRNLGISQNTRDRLDERSKSRQTQQKAQGVINVNDNINEAILKMPLIIRQQRPTGAAAVLNQVVKGIAVGIRARARQNEALQAIEGTDEQILEAATQSYEKIQTLIPSLEKLLGPKTITQALDENKSGQLTQSQKLLNILNPTHYINTFQKFTDNLHLTDNKAVRWQKIQEISKSLKEEQNRFDDFIALMQIKALEKMIMNLHVHQNKEATLPKLKEYLETTNIGIKTIEKQIAEAVEQKPSKKGVMKRLKNAIAKTESKKQLAEIKRLEGERQKYYQRKEELKKQIKDLQEAPKSSKDIQDERNDLIKKIEDIKLTRAASQDSKGLAQEIVSIRKEIQELRSDMDALKGRRSSFSR